MFFRLLLTSIFIVHSIQFKRNPVTRCLAGEIKFSADGKYTITDRVNDISVQNTSKYTPRIGKQGTYCAVYMMRVGKEYTVNFGPESKTWCDGEGENIPNLEIPNADNPDIYKSVIGCKSNPNHVAMFCGEDDNCNTPLWVESMSAVLEPEDFRLLTIFTDGSSPTIAAESTDEIFAGVAMLLRCFFAPTTGSSLHDDRISFWDQNSSKATSPILEMVYNFPCDHVRPEQAATPSSIISRSPPTGDNKI